MKLMFLKLEVNAYAQIYSDNIKVCTVNNIFIICMKIGITYTQIQSAIVA